MGYQYGDASIGYRQTIEWSIQNGGSTSETEAFMQEFTIAVTGSKGNPNTLLQPSGFTVDNIDVSSMELKWTYSITTGVNGWKLQYCAESSSD